MIKPSVGRIVLFHPHAGDGGDINGQPHAAIVAHVLDDRLINLTVFNENGSVYAKTSVQLLQDDDAAPAEGGHAAWMEYQKGQAAKTEALQAGVPAADLTAMHEKIDGAVTALTAKVEAAAAAPAALGKSVDSKFADLGDFLTTQFKEIEKKIAQASASA